MDLVVPVESILAIYARENGQGMMFGDEEAKPPQPPGTRSAHPAKPRLKVIK
jgi:stringent starvation protein B